MDNCSTTSSSLLSSSRETSTLKKNASKDLLTVTGDGSRRAIIKSLMKKSKKSHSTTKLRTEKVMRSALFSQLDDFLPQIKKANNDILMKTDEERREMDIENITDCSNVVEMDVLLAKMEEKDSSSDDSEEDITLKLPRKSSDQTSSKPPLPPRQNLITEIGPPKDTIRSTTPDIEESR